MFNGLIESCGTVAELRPIPAGYRIVVATPLAGELAPGGSIAVNGVCLLHDAGQNHTATSHVSFLFFS